MTNWKTSELQSVVEHLRRDPFVKSAAIKNVNGTMVAECKLYDNRTTYYNKNRDLIKKPEKTNE